MSTANVNGTYFFTVSGNLGYFLFVPEILNTTFLNFEHKVQLELCEVITNKSVSE